MYGEQQDNSTFALDPRVLLALAGGAVAGGIGKKYATKELSKGFEAAHARELAGIERGLSSKADAVAKLKAELSKIEKSAIESGVVDPYEVSSRRFLDEYRATNPEYLKVANKVAPAQKTYDDAFESSALARVEAGDRLAGKQEWVNEMGLAVGGVPAAMLGYGIGSGVMRKKDDQDAYRNPLQ